MKEYFRFVQQTDSERDMKGKQTIQPVPFLIELCTHNTQHFSIKNAVHLIVTIICWHKILTFLYFKGTIFPYFDDICTYFVIRRYIFQLLPNS